LNHARGASDHDPPVSFNGRSKLHLLVVGDLLAHVRRQDSSHDAIQSRADPRRRVQIPSRHRELRSKGTSPPSRQNATVHIHELRLELRRLELRAAVGQLLEPEPRKARRTKPDDVRAALPLQTLADVALVRFHDLQAVDRIQLKAAFFGRIAEPAPKTLLRDPAPRGSYNTLVELT
jgi:hypothetical protein